MMSTMSFARLLLAGAILAYSCASSSGQTSVTAKPEPFLNRNVTYLNAEAGVVLAGTFRRPTSGGPFPAVLLIPGSGRQDRDETVGRHKPAFELTDFLNGRGIAVLRVDRRGVGTSTGDFATATTQDFASDAEAGFRYLLTRPDIDPKHVGLIGHGEGAIMAAIVADRVPQTAFLVLLAAPAIPGEQVLLTQRERAERAAHMPEARIVLDKKVATMVYAMVREGKKTRDLQRALSKQQDLNGDLAEMWANQLPHLESPWLRFFLSYDPVPALQKVKCPVLALEGEKDMDVAPEQNEPALKAALSREGNPDVTVEILPGLNYFLQTANTGLPIEYPVLPEAISPVALDAIATWITRHTS